MSNEPKTFTQEQVDEMMMRHRRGLQAKVVELEQTVRQLRHQIAQLSIVEINPVAQMVLRAIGLVKEGKPHEIA